MNKTSLIALPVALLLGACMVGPDFKTPETKAASTYAAAGDAAMPADQHLALGKRIEGDWWAAFRSPALDGVVKLALTDNQDIAAARARVAAAQEAVKAAGGALLPQVSLGGTVAGQKLGASLFGPLNLNVPPYAYYTVGPTLSFPLDLFGGQRRTIEERAAIAEYQVHELNAALLTLTANVTAQALSGAAARAQIVVLRGIIANDTRNVDLVQTAVQFGSDTRTQLLTAQSQLASDRTLLPPLQQQTSTASHALAILVGRAPADWSPPEFTLDDFTLPGEIPASLPSDLVHDRPDIRAAEAQLHAASAAIGVATANLYPKIDLVGTFTQQALTPGGLFNSVASAWSLAANIVQPLFTGGQLTAERRAAIDRYTEALATYRQTILTAFGQVADRLQSLANNADELHAQNEAVQAAAAALDLARTSFTFGNSGILDVIDTQRRLSQAQLGLSYARAQRLLDTVQLFLALGGTPPTGVAAQPEPPAPKM